MSVQRPIEEATCSYCNGDRDPHASVKGSYCSRECYYKHKGGKALNLVKHDHRVCASCLRWLKSVQPPNEDWVNEHGSRTQVALNNGAEYHNIEGQAVLDLTECSDTLRTAVDAVIGFQYTTENSEQVIKERTHSEEWRRTYTTGTGCSCGCSNPNERAEELQEAELATVLANHVVTFRELEREGQLEERINKTLFFGTYRETADLEYALGRGLYG